MASSWVVVDMTGADKAWVVMVEVKLIPGSVETELFMAGVEGELVTALVEVEMVTASVEVKVELVAACLL